MKPVWLDDYERHARLVPGFLVLLPLAVAAIGIGVNDYPFAAIAVGAFVVLGGPVALASIVRERGVALQERLFEAWGGPPTTQLLRATGGPSDPDRDRRRSAVESAVGVDLPSATDEATDAATADVRRTARPTTRWCTPRIGATGLPGTPLQCARGGLPRRSWDSG